MTVKQKQCLLAYLGYYTGTIDGDWGPLSQAATEAFQRGYQLTVDGVFGDATAQRIREVIASGEAPAAAEQEETAGTFWDEIEYFTREEFRCKCGGKYCNGYPAEPHEATVRYADAIRKRIGKPVPVNSGLRCPTWNSVQGGVSNSNHIGGGAVDLGKPSGVTPAQMYAIAEEVIGDTGGIGKYSWGIHIDSRSTKSRWNG